MGPDWVISGWIGGGRMNFVGQACAVDEAASLVARRFLLSIVQSPAAEHQPAKGRCRGFRLCGCG